MQAAKRERIVQRSSSRREPPVSHRRWRAIVVNIKRLAARAASPAQVEACVAKHGIVPVEETLELALPSAAYRFLGVLVAVWREGFPAMNISALELGALLGCSDRYVRTLSKRLREAALLRRAHNYDDAYARRFGGAYFNHGQWYENSYIRNVFSLDVKGRKLLVGLVDKCASAPVRSEPVTDGETGVPISSHLDLPEIFIGSRPCEFVDNKVSAPLSPTDPDALRAPSPAAPCRTATPTATRTDNDKTAIRGNQAAGLGKLVANLLAHCVPAPTSSASQPSPPLGRSPAHRNVCATPEEALRAARALQAAGHQLPRSWLKQLIMDENGEANV